MSLGDNMSKKQIKKKTISKVEVVESEPTLSKFLITIGVVLGCILIFYVVTTLIKKEKDDESETPTEEEISYSNILFGNLLSYDGEYYVLAVSDDDVSKNLYTTYLSSYSSKDKSLKYYTINLDDEFNKNYISESSVLNTNDITKIKVKTTTLFRIKGKKIAKYYEGKEAVIAQLKEMTK